MDHDAMLMHVNRLKTFRDDFMKLFPGGADGFKAHVEAKTAGTEPPPITEGFAANPGPGNVGLPDTALEDLNAVMALGRRFEALLPDLEKAIEDVHEMKQSYDAAKQALSEPEKGQDSAYQKSGTDTAAGTEQTSQEPAQGIQATT